ncbi:hypothetical protein J4210_02360 [Candidatus Woesearchaeota archaeon]|nr:hypothetical protein [Candidatus Woesearchaeota archaeon]
MISVSGGRNRKGQMEMIGLVVIVLLVTIAFLFLAQFALRDNSDDQFFARKQLAVSTLTAISKTTVQNCELDGPLEVLSVNDLLKDCADNPEGGFGFLCQGKYSCAYLQENLFPILFGGSLDTFKRRYEFVSFIIQNPDPPLLFLTGKNGGCQGRKNVDTSGDFPLNAGVGVIESRLLICD